MRRGVGPPTVVEKFPDLLCGAFVEVDAGKPLHQMTMKVGVPLDPEVAGPFGQALQDEFGEGPRAGSVFDDDVSLSELDPLQHHLGEGPGTGEEGSDLGSFGGEARDEGQRLTQGGALGRALGSFGVT